MAQPSAGRSFAPAKACSSPLLDACTSQAAAPSKVRSCGSTSQRPAGCRELLHAVRFDGAAIGGPKPPAAEARICRVRALRRLRPERICMIGRLCLVSNECARQRGRPQLRPAKARSSRPLVASPRKLRPERRCAVQRGALRTLRPRRGRQPAATPWRRAAARRRTRLPSPLGCGRIVSGVHPRAGAARFDVAAIGGPQLRSANARIVKFAENTAFGLFFCGIMRKFARLCTHSAWQTIVNKPFTFTF